VGAIREVLIRLPQAFPPMVITQHIPPVFPKLSPIG
jgi:chemotaxis response regulator CheB